MTGSRLYRLARDASEWTQTGTCDILDAGRWSRFIAGTGYVLALETE